MHGPKASAEWAEVAEAKLREHGHKASGPRSAVLESIGRQSCVVTAQDIADELKRRKKKVGIATVYRTLEVLEDLKLVQRLDLGTESARYEPAMPDGRHHHHHFVCRNCGEAIPFEDAALERAINGARQAAGRERRRARRDPQGPLPGLRLRPMPWPIDPFSLPFMQRAALEILLLAPLAGVIGAQIVLRHLAFFTHAVGTATFPGLVIAGPAGIPPALAALAVGGTYAAGLERLGRVRGLGRDVATALLLVAALAIGIVLASDVFDSGSGVDRLLFGSLLAIGDDELLATLIASLAVLAAAAACRRTWIATGFDPQVAPALGLRSRVADRLLVAAIAVAVIAAVDAVGALLVSAILVMPAATARLFTRSVVALELSAVGLALAEGIGGLLLAFELDVPPGAAIAVLGGATFAVVATVTALSGRAAESAA